MARRRFVQIQEDGEFKLVPFEEYRVKSRQHYVIPDIEPYRAITGDMAGKWISGRAAHRAFLRRNNLVEVGNEHAHMTKYQGKSHDNPTLRAEHIQRDEICRSLVKNLERLKARR